MFPDTPWHGIVYENISSDIIGVLRVRERYIFYFLYLADALSYSGKQLTCSRFRHISFITSYYQQMSNLAIRNDSLDVATY